VRKGANKAPITKGKQTMNTLAKLLASIAALVAASALFWIAYNGVQIQHTGYVHSIFRTDPLEELKVSAKVDLDHSGQITETQLQYR
jgi:hypothetical protein